MNFHELKNYLHDNKIPISAFYWCIKWNLNLNEKFGIDIGTVKIIYEGFKDQDYRRFENENNNMLYLCIIFNFEKFDLNISININKQMGDYDIALPTDWLGYDVKEVKVSKKIVKTFREIQP